MLMLGIVSKQPMLLLKTRPLILLLEWIKSTIFATITTESERVTKEVRDVTGPKEGCGQHDPANAGPPSGALG